MAEGFKTEDFVVYMKTDDLTDSSIITAVIEIIPGRKNKHNKKDRNFKQLHNCRPVEIALATIFEYMKRRRKSYSRIKWEPA